MATNLAWDVFGTPGEKAWIVIGPGLGNRERWAALGILRTAGDSTFQPLRVWRNEG